MHWLLRIYNSFYTKECTIHSTCHGTDGKSDAKGQHTRLVPRMYGGTHLKSSEQYLCQEQTQVQRRKHSMHNRCLGRTNGWTDGKR